MWYNTFFGNMPLPSSLSAKKLARFENDIEFNNNMSALLSLVCSIFKWEGLPDTCDPRALEAALLFRGCACIVPYGNGYTNMGAGPGGGFNIHGEYTTLWAYGWNGFSKQYQNYIPGAEITPELQDGPGGFQFGSEMETGILIRDNYWLHPYINDLLTGAKRLTDTMRRIDTTAYNLVWPGLFTVDDGQVNTVKALLQNHDDNVPIVIGRQSLDQLGVQKVDFGVQPETLKTLWDHYNYLYSNLMERFGINADPTTGKRERVNTMEVSANNSRIDLIRDDRLHSREKACRDMRELWGLDVSVDFDETITERAMETAEQLKSAIDSTPYNGNEEGGNYGMD